ncbi:cryptochrome/photolyase family protein [Saccharomonospora piscinae]|uniref:cryptochrome/photolyase family protein n=1 Tax=Saccharomonospora piscinae TaxID=687388 RepID=UPI00046392FB|nr:deoxyribodipyrimidine photo-lyase [Saccharomonospora piscinae]
MSVSLALFTRDLRVHDNPMLHTAADGADHVIPLFVLDDAILRTGFPSPNRAAFLVDCLTDLDATLRELGARLIVRRGDPVTEVLDLVTHHAITDVHLSGDVSRYARQRQRRLGDALDEHGARLHLHDDVITAVAPGAVTPTGNRDHFAVFTPYLRRWTELPKRTPLPPPPRLRLPPRVTAHALPDPGAISRGSTAPDLPGGGETTGRDLLGTWLRDDVTGYADGHDDLAGDRTSRLSPHLHFGTVSATEAAHRAGRSAGAKEFVSQLAWRDFHHQVLAARPACSTHDYRSRGDRWRHAPDELRAWQEGRTGYPIVDAGMRQLLREGWMHNRARLITASFLTKTLYLDWREGARHFLRHLTDGDIANNQLNWQWVAGTGTDTRPNRVLNPLRQADRYDPRGDYVRRYLPELRDIPGPEVHRPWTLPDHQRRELDYPDPIVDLGEGRERFLTARG